MEQPMTHIEYHSTDNISTNSCKVRSLILNEMENKNYDTVRTVQQVRTVGQLTSLTHIYINVLSLFIKNEGVK